MTDPAPPPPASPRPASPWERRAAALAPELDAALAARRRAGLAKGPLGLAWRRLWRTPSARASLLFLALWALLSGLAPLWPLPSPIAMRLSAEPSPPRWPWAPAATLPQRGELELRPTRRLRCFADDGWAHRAVVEFTLAGAAGSGFDPGPTAALLAERLGQVSGRRASAALEALPGGSWRLCLSVPLQERAPGLGDDRGSLSGRPGLEAQLAADGAFSPPALAALPGAPRLAGLRYHSGTWDLSAFDRWLVGWRGRLFGLWQSGPWLGTDAKGRDLMARIVWGSRVSLQVALVAGLCSLTIGLVYGALAGLSGGRIDNAMMRLVDALYALPLIFGVIFLVAILNEYRSELASRGIGRLTVFYAVLGAVSWLTMARVVRGQVLRLKRQDFVLALEALGASRARILFLHLLPNVLPIALVYLTLSVPAVLLYEAFLSFLGLGVEPPQVSWGLLALDGSEALSKLHVFWWLLLFPALAMGSTLLALSLLGDALQAALDPGAGRRDRA